MQWLLIAVCLMSLPLKKKYCKAFTSKMYYEKSLNKLWCTFVLREKLMSGNQKTLPLSIPFLSLVILHFTTQPLGEGSKTNWSKLSIMETKCPIPLDSSSDCWSGLFSLFSSLFWLVLSLSSVTPTAFGPSGYNKERKIFPLNFFLLANKTLSFNKKFPEEKANDP